MAKKTIRTFRGQGLSRRTVVGGAAALFGGMGLLRARASWGATNTAPEVTDMKFGIIALTDCSPIVIAHEKGLVQEVRHQLDGQQGRQLGGDPRLAVERRHPGDAHADSACRSRRRWACSARRRSRWSSRGCSTATASRSRSRPSCKGKVQADPKALKPLVDGGEGEGHADDVRHDLPARARTRCGCATGWPRAASTPTRTSR